MYWCLDENLTRDEWQHIAIKFKDATKVAGLLADPARTSDPTSLLRPAGTTNRKSQYGPSGSAVEGWWFRFLRVSADAFEAACDRVGMSATLLGGEKPRAFMSLGTALEPTNPAPWFDALPEREKLPTLDSMMSALPIEHVSDYKEWLSVGAALKGIPQIPDDVLFDKWAVWSQSSQEGAESWRKSSTNEQRRRWNGFNRSGVGALIMRAKAAAWSPEWLLGNSDAHTTYLAVIESQDGSSERWTPTQAAAYVSQKVIYVSADNQYLLDGLPLSKEALDTSLARRMPVSSGRQMTASDLVKKGAGLVVAHIGYKPGAARTFTDREGRKIANTWREHFIEAVDPCQEDAHIFVNLLKHVANGSAETAKGIKRLFTKYAYLYCNPSARIRHATLLIGKVEGCGKSTLTSAIPAALFGAANVRTVDNKELSSDFNSYAQGARILVLPELWLGSRKDAQIQANNLKPLITDDYIPVVRKGKDGRNIENCTTIFASSNYTDAAVFGVYDRRYDVTTTDAGRMPIGLSTQVYGLISRRPGALVSLVLRYGKDEQSFDPNAAPPETSAKLAMREASRAGWAQRMRDEFDSRGGPFGGDSVAVMDVIRMLADEFQPLPSHNAIRAELLSMGDGAFSMLAQRRQGTRTQTKRLVVLRNVGAWRQAGATSLYSHYEETVAKVSTPFAT